jgi:hypothetical protein
MASKSVFRLRRPKRNWCRRASDSREKAQGRPPMRSLRARSWAAFPGLGSLIILTIWRALPKVFPRQAARRATM